MRIRWVHMPRVDGSRLPPGAFELLPDSSKSAMTPLQIPSKGDEVCVCGHPFFAHSPRALIPDVPKEVQRGASLGEVLCRGFVPVTVSALPTTYASFRCDRYQDLSAEHITTQTLCACGARITVHDIQRFPSDASVSARDSTPRAGPSDGDVSGSPIRVDFVEVMQSRRADISATQNRFQAMNRHFPPSQPLATLRQIVGHPTGAVLPPPPPPPPPPPAPDSQQESAGLSPKAAPPQGKGRAARTSSTDAPDEVEYPVYLLPVPLRV